MKKFSYIIPFNSAIDNINNLRKIIKWVNGWKGIEIVVVEYDSKSSKLEFINEAFTHIFVKNDMSNYSKSWAYNIGVKRSHSDVIICGDSNTVTNPENIIKGVEMLKEYDMVTPFNTLIEVTSNQLSDFVKMDKDIHGPIVGTNHSDDRVVNISSGISIYNREALLKLGGWEEKFKMECTEDFQSHKVKRLTKWIQLDGKAYKFGSGQPHNDHIVSSDVNVNNQLKSLSNEQLQRYISSTYQNVGSLTKYE